MPPRGRAAKASQKAANESIPTPTAEESVMPPTVSQLRTTRATRAKKTVPTVPAAEVPPTLPEQAPQRRTRKRAASKTESDVEVEVKQTKPKRAKKAPTTPAVEVEEPVKFEEKKTTTRSKRGAKAVAPTTPSIEVEEPAKAEEKKKTTRRKRDTKAVAPTTATIEVEEPAIIEEKKTTRSKRGAKAVAPTEPAVEVEAPVEVEEKQSTRSKRGAKAAAPTKPAVEIAEPAEIEEEKKKTTRSKRAAKAAVPTTSAVEVEEPAKIEEKKPTRSKREVKAVVVEVAEPAQIEEKEKTTRSKRGAKAAVPPTLAVEVEVEEPAKIEEKTTTRPKRGAKSAPPTEAEILTNTAPVPEKRSRRVRKGSVTKNAEEAAQVTTPAVEPEAPKISEEVEIETSAKNVVTIKVFEETLKVSEESEISTLTSIATEDLETVKASRIIEESETDITTKEVTTEDLAVEASKIIEEIEIDITTKKVTTENLEAGETSKIIEETEIDITAKKITTEVVGEDDKTSKIIEEFAIERTTKKVTTEVTEEEENSKISEEVEISASTQEVTTEAVPASKEPSLEERSSEEQTNITAQSLESASMTRTESPLSTPMKSHASPSVENFDFSNPIFGVYGEIDPQLLQSGGFTQMLSPVHLELQNAFLASEEIPEIEMLDAEPPYLTETPESPFPSDLVSFPSTPGSNVPENAVLNPMSPAAVNAGQPTVPESEKQSEPAEKSLAAAPASPQTPTVQAGMAFPLPNVSPWFMRYQPRMSSPLKRPPLMYSPSIESGTEEDPKASPQPTPTKSNKRLRVDENGITSTVGDPSPLRPDELNPMDFNTPVATPTKHEGTPRKIATPGSKKGRSRGRSVRRESSPLKNSMQVADEEPEKTPSEKKVAKAIAMASAYDPNQDISELRDDEVPMTPLPGTPTTSILPDAITSIPSPVVAAEPELANTVAANTPEPTVAPEPKRSRRFQPKKDKPEVRHSTGSVSATKEIVEEGTRRNTISGAISTAISSSGDIKHPRAEETRCSYLDTPQEEQSSPTTDEDAKLKGATPSSPLEGPGDEEISPPVPEKVEAALPSDDSTSKGARKSRIPLPKSGSEEGGALPSRLGRFSHNRNLSDRELSKLTARNTSRNSVYKSVSFERKVVRMEGARPPSPKRETQSAAAEQSRSDRKRVFEETGIALGPGDEAGYIPPGHEPSLKRVKWHEELEREPSEEERARFQTGKGILAAERIRRESGNHHHITIQKFLYEGERDVMEEPEF